jgi:hypothetical protein
VSLRPRHGYAADFPRGLPTGNGKPTQEFPADQRRVRTASCPNPPGSSRCQLERRNNAGSSRTPLHPASRTRAIWQY